MFYGTMIHAEAEHKLLDSANLLAAPVSKLLHVDGYSEAAIRIELSHVAASKISMRVEATWDMVNFFFIQDNFGLNTSVSTGNLVMSRDVSGNYNWLWNTPTIGVAMRFSFTGTGPTGDTINVWGGVFA